jgi:hypothetical protein
MCRLMGSLGMAATLILSPGCPSSPDGGPAPLTITVEPLNAGPGPLVDFPVQIQLRDLGRRLPADSGNISFTLPDDRTVLPSEVTAYDPRRGDLTAWVRIPILEAGQGADLHLHFGKVNTPSPAAVWDEHHKIVRHLGGLRDSDLELPRTGALVFDEALTVEAWAYAEESRAEALLPLVSKWAPRESMTAESFSAYDAGRTDGLDCFMYYGAVFDGRFVYFCPIRSKLRDRLSVHAHVLRYDTHKDFYSPQSWEAYDAGATDGLKTVCYYGAVFDGRYVFFTPRDEGTGYHSRVLRLDTTEAFKDPRSWQAFDAGLPHSKQSGAFDGRYIYFCPGYDGTTLTGKTLAEDEGEGSGQVLRFDTAGDFKNPSAYRVFDAKSVSPDAVCFDGAAFDGKYIYFAPLQRGGALRYDTTADFSAPSSWEFFDARPLGMKACVGVVFDGRHMYYVAYAHGTMLRFDTRLAFRDPTSWGTYDAAGTGGIDTGGFDGAFFDGRYIVFVPWIRTVAPGENKNRVHANFLRYDTQGLFNSPKSWDSYNAERTDGLVSRGYNGGAFDGRFFYGAPMYDGDSPDLHGRILRYDSTGKNGTFSLRWSDVGHNGGLCAAVPGPNFLVNTENGALSIAAHKALTPGWHHVAGVYDGRSIRLYIDGVLAAEREGSGRLARNTVDIEIGRIQQGVARFPGVVSEVRVSDVARSGAWIAAACRTLLRPSGVDTKK